MIEITFPDGNKKKYEKGTSVLDILKGLPQKLQQDALAAKVDDQLVDLSFQPTKNSTLQILTFEDKEGKPIFWHSASHLMTQAVLRVFKGQNIGLGVGFAIDDGFYQDYDMDPIHPEDLVKIEDEMKKIVNEKHKITHKTVTKKEALEFYKNDPYKTELVNDVPGDEVTMYSQGEFDNLCKGPHVPHTGKIKAFKLTKIAGAYWRGDSKNKQLQRIYGISFPDRKMLTEYLTLIEEAKKRDHRELGKKLDLFSFHDEGKGFPFFHPRGMIIWNELLDFWREEHKKAGYVEIKTPMILNRSLWETSGHWMNYKQNMYTVKIDEEDNAIKPMNCPGGFLVYKEKLHSYRELPLRMGEIGLVHRHELSGVLAGLFRVRAFHQDDAHIFMTSEQIKDEVLGVLMLAEKFYKKFGLDFHLELSTRPTNSVGTDEQWETSTKALKAALESTGKTFKINEGDGAFYGPKIDIHIKDAIGRTWQCGTIQLDMTMPEKFDMTYEGKDGQRHRVVLIHRVIYGSMERFFGVITEHFAGKFPLWLSPVHVRILTVSEKFDAYGEKVRKMFEDAGIRVEMDTRTESIPKKVRDAQVQYIPLILTVGEKEESAGTVAVRTLKGDVKFGVKVEDFIEIVKKNISDRELEFKM